MKNSLFSYFNESSIKINPINLHFVDEKLENDFSVAYNKDSLILGKLGIVLTFLLFTFYGFLDQYAYPINYEEIWFIRAVVDIFLAILFLMTFTKNNVIHLQKISTVMIFFAGLALLYIYSYPSQTNYFHIYLSAYALLIVGSFTVTGLMFFNAVKIVLLMNIFTMALFYMKFDLISNLFFAMLFVSMTSIVVISSYFSVILKRKLFLDEIATNKLVEDLSKANNKLDKASKEIVQNQLNLIETIIDSVPIRIFWKDKDGVYLGANQLFIDDAELNTAADIIGKTDFEMTWRESAQQFIEDDAGVVNSGVARLNYEEVQPKEDGSAIYIRTSKVPLIDTHNNTLGILGIYDDITESKTMEVDLKIAKENAEKANLSKSTFLANMSHEIRTPLNAIMGFIDILKEEHKDIKHLETIDNSSKSLLQIINDILDISKIESGKLDVEYIDFDAIYEFQSTQDLFQAKCDEKSIKFYTTFENLPKALNGDPLRIKQVVSNLLSNAIKFTPPNQSIFLDMDYDDGTLFVSVKDEGIGISQDKQETIFESFTQADASTTREYGGTGLGLSISSNLIKLMDGELKVYSTLGEGSTFSFSLPLEEAKAVVAPIVVNKNIDFSNLNVLLVEDNKANQMFMKVVFKKLKLSYEIANDGLEAIDYFKNNTYDVILMDENMPNMNGIKATGIIRDLESTGNLEKTPIIALTANALKGDRERFLEAGMDDYLTKPLEKNKLISVLSNI